LAPGRTWARSMSMRRRSEYSARSASSTSCSRAVCRPRRPPASPARARRNLKRRLTARQQQRRHSCRTKRARRASTPVSLHQMQTVGSGERPHCCSGQWCAAAFLRTGTGCGPHKQTDRSHFENRKHSVLASLTLGLNGCRRKPRGAPAPQTDCRATARAHPRRAARRRPRRAPAAAPRGARPPRPPARTRRRQPPPRPAGRPARAAAPTPPRPRPPGARLRAIRSARLHRGACQAA